MVARKEKKEKENTTYTVLIEIKENEIPKVPKNQNLQQQQYQVPQAPTNVVRRSIGLSASPKRYSPSLYYLLLNDSGEPIQVDTRKKWEKGMKEEMESLFQNQTWDLVHFHVDKIALQNKWVYMLKEEDGGKKWYKAKLVVKGFAQKNCIYFC